MPNDGLDGLAAFEQFASFCIECFELASVLDGCVGVFCVHTTVAQVGIDRLWSLSRVLHQVRDLLHLFVECMTVVRGVGKASRSYDQVVLDGGGYADFHTEFIRGFALAFADARHLWRKRLGIPY